MQAKNILDELRVLHEAVHEMIFKRPMIRSNGLFCSILFG
jgi:hypothetical protein